ncbi:MAG TPA: flagellar basal body L-ring protein FlgH [Stellaceae bacterium]|nr:flagellar basal body L-ring protein FlgH [Stellaceae bacterium]
MAPTRLLTRITAAALAAASLAGCNAFSRITQVGEAPPLTTIQDPKTQPGYQPVSLPMPAPIVGERQPNSLWKAGSRAFFKDQRAAQVGDILTVLVSFDDKAQLNNETQTQRTTNEQDTMPHVMGFENQIQKILPHAADPASLINITGSTNNDGKALINREEKITLEVAALVTQVLPNGNLVVQGHQEIRVNYEVRDLQITGVLRPQDISSTNTVSLDKLAEARVSYGGRGQLTNDQQPRYGQQLLDIIAPF